MDIRLTSLLLLASVFGHAASSWSCPEKSGLFAYPYECSLYYLCRDGTPYLLKCPPGQLFNPKPKVRRCDHAYNVECQAISTTTTTQRPTTTPEPTTTEPTTTTTPSTTTTTTTPRPTTTPTTTTTTTPRPTTTPTTTTTTTPRPTTTPTTTTTTTPRPTTTPTTTTTTTTPRPTTTTTTTTTTPRPTTSIPPTHRPEDICLSDDGYYPNPDDCQEYYQCYPGGFVKRRCPDGQLFDSILSGCNWAHLVVCPTTTTTQSPTTATTSTTTPSTTTTRQTTTTTRPTTTTTTTTTTVVPPTHRPEDICLSDDGYYPNPDDCQEYYQCYPGGFVKRRCPDGQLFDSILSGCNWAHLVICPTTTKATRPTPTGTRTTDSATTPSFKECPEDDGLFPDPKNCQEYFHCSGGSFVKRRCPNGELFDPIRKICDWEYNVDCQVTTTTSGPTQSTTPGEFVCPLPNGMFPHPTDRTKFFECVNDHPHLGQCPPGLVFKVDRCDWP